MQLELWQIILGIIGTGGLSGLLAAWAQRERVRIEARQATVEAWQRLTDEQQEINNLQAAQIKRLSFRVEAQEGLIETLQKELSHTREKLAEAERQIHALQAENQQLRNKLEYERSRRRQLEKRVKEKAEHE